MRILIDECLDWRLGRALTGHDSVSVQKMGWGGIKNGRLLALAQAEFDVFLTADRNLSFQQNTTKFQIAVVVLVAGSTQLNKTLPLMPKVLALLPQLTPGKVAIVNSYTRLLATAAKAFQLPITGVQWNERFRLLGLFLLENCRLDLL